MVHENLPKIIVGVGVLATAVGFGAYFSGGSEKAELPIVKKRSVENSNVATRDPSAVSNALSTTSVAGSDVASATPQSASRTLAAMPQVRPDVSTRPPIEEAQYFCGAQTKKGTPCSRRVKGNVRCYQHQGMPAMLAGDKLKIG